MSVEQWSDLLFSEAGPRDGHAYGSVRAVNEDGSYMVQLNASSTLTRCAPFCTAMVGDRVKVVINANGKCDAIGRLGGEIGGGGEVVMTVNDASNYVAGKVFAHAGTNDPAGALLCDGRAVSRREYWELFDAIGTTYGAGDGSTTFNLPNIESRTIIGESDSYALGATGGEEKHLLDETEAADYSMPYTNSTTSGQWDGAISGSVLYTKAATVTSFVRMTRKKDQQPFNVMQPYIVMRYFITTGKGDPVSGINPADYVVEWGKTGEWTWRKYASGVAECWLSKAFSTATGFSAWGSGYLSNEKLSPREYPFEFVDYPMVTADYRTVDGDWSMSAVMSQGGKTESPTVQGFRSSPMSSGTTYAFQVSVHAIGPIKEPSASGGVETIAPTIAERFEGIEADILDMRKTKVLATTASFMNADQTVTLSEAISEQDNGVMLVWSGYYNGSSQNYDWVFVPVPKHHVLNHNGQGICCSALCGDGHMMKYVYVSDTKIEGHSSGTDTSTIGGVTRANNKYVLRYVIGY